MVGEMITLFMGSAHSPEVIDFWLGCCVFLCHSVCVCVFVCVCA